MRPVGHWHDWCQKKAHPEEYISTSTSSFVDGVSTTTSSFADGVLDSQQPELLNPPPPRCVILVGLPGSGKSTLAARFPSPPFTVINQDTLKTRNNCESLAASVLSKKGRIVIDRCNSNKLQRSHWFNATRRAFGSEADVWIVELQVPAQECIRRCKARKGHPTLSGDEAEGVIVRMGREYEAPNKRKEGEYTHFICKDDQDRDNIISLITGISQTSFLSQSQ